MKNMLFTLSCAALCLPASVAWAHDGHGMATSHWHATDVWGFLGLGALALLAFLFGRK